MAAILPSRPPEPPPIRSPRPRVEEDDGPEHGHVGGLAALVAEDRLAGEAAGPAARQFHPVERALLDPALREDGLALVDAEGDEGHDGGDRVNGHHPEPRCGPRHRTISQMPRISAGLLMYRRLPKGPEVLLVHPGGPFWKNKDEGAWSIPKGEVEPDEDLLAAARREFREELGFEPRGPYTQLATVKQKAGKIVHAWAFEGDCDPSTCK